MTGPAEIEDNALQTKPFSYDPEAVSSIINHLSRRSAQLTTRTARSVEPFQLQVICQRIERIAAKRQQRTGNPLTLTMTEIGGEAALKATLQDFYKQELSALPSLRQRGAVGRLCEEYLISPEGRRLSLEANEIHRQLNLSGETLGKLVDRRLLRSDQRADSTYYELSHDTLVEPVLATSRARRKFVGALVFISGMIFLGLGGLLAMIALIAGFSMSSRQPPLTRTSVACLIMILSGLLFVAGISWCRSGSRTFRR
jgi:hypothetical protein